MRLPLSLWALIALQIDTTLSQQHHHDHGPQGRSLSLPTAIRKMPPDQAAKFHPSYCAFPAESPSPSVPLAGAILARDTLEEESVRRAGNASLVMEFRPPFAVSLDDYERDHSRKESEDKLRLGSIFHRAAAVLRLLEKRQWACPSGTSGCGAIGYPNSCCHDGETCVEVQDTGLGPVGCCPAGATCAGAVMACTDGSTPCGSDVGGGCCIPGYVCQGVGCVKSQSATPTPRPTPTGVTTMTSTSTSIVDAPTPSTVIVTVIVTITPTQPPPRTSTRTQTVSASSQQQSIPSTDSGIGAPLRPTSSSTNGIATYCPTGFYACLASAGGGCCQTGRNCETTSCPPISMTTIVTANGVTVVVPVSGVPAATTGQCANGWFMCGSDAGPIPGCCPSGYSCGTASCSVVTEGATATVAKALPGGAVRVVGGMARWAGVVGMVGIFLVL